MKKIFISLALGAFAILPLSGCTTVASYSAADDIRNLVIALQSGDANAISRYVDKRALRNQTANIARDIIIEKSRNSLGGGLAGQIAAVTAADALKPVINALADRAVQPDVLAYMARQAGLNQNTQIPSRFRASLALQDIDSNNVCVPDDKTKNCALYFGKYGDSWKLNGFNEQMLREKMMQLK